MVRAVGAQLGLHSLDANWLADDDGISPIAVAGAGGDRPAFIPYTQRALQWHTDGYYHSPQRAIRGMVLHCVRPAAQGGATALADPDLAYIAVREANPEWLEALLAPQAMTIPERVDDDGVARPEQTGPVFVPDPAAGHVHMRYTARTRSIAWHDDPATAQAQAFVRQWLQELGRNFQYRLVLQPGMGLVCNNVLHDRAAFEDDPAAPRLLYRARFHDTVACGVPPWASD